MSAALWDELVATALLGTARRPPARPAPDGDGALEQALDGLCWDDAERALLGAAALVSGFRAAGWQPPALDAPPDPAPPDERPLCSPRAAAILGQLLEADPGLLLPEWLRLADAAGVRPPPEQLPALLDAGHSGSLRAAILQAGGDRLRWLAARNERWSWAAGGAAAGAGLEERWQSGTRDERVTLLQAVRAEDPARGLALLTSTWSADAAQDRDALLAALGIGLTPADVPFLEAALDDRSTLVRRQAARLLAGLPSSALAARMAQRVTALATVDGRGRRRRRLQVQTPPEPDDAALRDGIEDFGKPDDMGPGAWHLAQLVGAAPLALWAQLTGEDPAGTYALARGADHERALKHGWSLAARRQRDPAWSALLLHETGDPRFLGALAPAAADELGPALLAAAPNAHTLTDILERMPAPWSPVLSRAAITHLVRTLSAPDTLWGLQLGDVAFALDLAVSDRAVSAFAPLLQGDALPAVRRAVDELLAILDLRQTMTRELTPR